MSKGIIKNKQNHPKTNKQKNQTRDLGFKNKTDVFSLSNFQAVQSPDTV